MDKRKNSKVPSKKKKGKKSKKKVDKNLTGEAAETAKKELISSLMAKCNMSEEQVLAAYDSFYAKYPSGEITQTQFVEQSTAGIISESLFRVFDEDKSGELSFYEFLQIRDIVIGLFRLAGIEEDDDLVTVCVSDIRDAVDEEGDGDISKEEFVRNAMKSKFIFNMLKE